MLLWNGSCIVHETFSEKELVKLKIRNQDAKIIAHPECPENILNYANFYWLNVFFIKIYF